MTASEYRRLYARSAPADSTLTAKQYQEQAAGKNAATRLKSGKNTTNQITKAAVLWLNLNGFKAWRNNNGAVFSVKRQSFLKNKNHQLGVPDIIGYQKGTGRALYIEVKAGKDKLSPEQIQFLADAAAAGAITGVIHSSLEIETIIQNYLNAA